MCGCLPLMVVCLIMHPFSFAYIPHTPILIHKQCILSLLFTNSTYSSSHSLTTHTLLLIHKQHILLLSFTNNTYSDSHSLTTHTLTFIHKQHAHSISVDNPNQPSHSLPINTRIQLQSTHTQLPPTQRQSQRGKEAANKLQFPRLVFRHLKNGKTTTRKRWRRLRS